MKSQIITYKIIAKGEPSYDDKNLRRLCSLLNANEKDKNVIYQVQDFAEQDKAE